MEQILEIPIDDLTPARLWRCLPAETRSLAARSVFDDRWDEPTSRAEALAAIASTLRFREQTVRRLPVDKRVDYLVRVVRPNDSLATTLLTALHLVHRRELLGAFLDALGIPQEDGVIEEEHEFDPPAEERLTAAAASLRDRFPAEDVRVYLATLVALDPEHWTGLSEILRRGDH